MKSQKNKPALKGNFLEKFFSRQTTEYLLDLLKEKIEEAKASRIAQETKAILIQELRNNRGIDLSSILA